jgi:hypothetical protein
MDFCRLFLKLMEINVPISTGELIDKITILEIKKIKIQDASKIKNVKKELDLLNKIYLQIITINKEIEIYTTQLKKINLQLWDIEESIRDCERRNDFGEYFIELSRKIYIKNDLRYNIKNEINKIFSSKIFEEKSYSKYLQNNSN